MLRPRVELHLTLGAAATARNALIGVLVAAGVSPLLH